MTSPDSPETVRTAGLVTSSRVNGPGRRIVLWVQGCTLGCPACFNPQTHDAGGTVEAIEALLARILAARGPRTDGLTFSGGEPFQQAVALASLATRLRRTWPEVSLMAFSGYALEELRGPTPPPGAADLLAQLDLLVDGRFEVQAPSTRPWRGSAGQRLWVLGRRPDPAEDTPAGTAEVHVEGDGTVLLSGFPDPALRRAIRALGHAPAR